MNWRLWGLAVACLAALSTLVVPRFPLPREAYRYVFVIDITQSMNAQDYHVENMPTDRLGFAKESIKQAIRDLPCGSEVGLGLFTTQSTQLLFEPMEVCEHLAAIDETLSHVDWRMAWAANSLIAQGLFSALRNLTERDSSLRLVFLTDGQDAPAQTFKRGFDGRPGEVAGLIVGVGGTQPTLLPKYDRENHMIGYWENADVDAAAVSGGDGEEGKGDAPALPWEGHYQTKLDETRLLELSAATGLRYHRLVSPKLLSKQLQSADFAEYRVGLADVRWLPALLALLLLLGIHWRRRRSA
ncbi:VWA domain-containing protein [Methylogaea oryzae]|uniref:VWFA domain-containing protein n=1 Tax=Methylogaea oryzae TaxID=1295382 RepID=A0A8D4VTR4_9GAMM|nr:vWA domain-containing protein [Methylogaea oryzae]BBL72462.1 hypothetical protein MoryE10_30680 [Methylogaea oryzae]